MQVTGKRRYLACTPRWFVFLCLALVALLGAAQVLHFHPDPLNGTADRCQLCLALHATPAVAHGIQLSFTFHITAHLPASADPGHSSVPALFVLFSRPPPSLA
jgi:hypothetical protein